MLIAIDVGVTSGIAIKVDDKYITMITTESEEVYDLVASEKWDAVIYERYTGQNISKAGLHTVRLIGAVQALCYTKKVPCIGQMPFERKAYIAQAKDILKGNAFTAVHEIDALAHLLRYEDKKHGPKISDDDIQHRRKKSSSTYTRKFPNRTSPTGLED